MPANLDNTTMVNKLEDQLLKSKKNDLDGNIKNDLCKGD